MSGQTEYACEIREVFSGDDLIGLIDLGVEGLWKRQRLRLAGVDTPNAINANGDTVAGKVRTAVRNLTRGRRARITLVTKNTSSWVVILVVETPDGPVNVNEHLISQGYQYTKQDKPAPATAQQGAQA